MQSSQPSVFARDHTLLGVCEALGEDFGFNPVYLRVTLAVLLFWNPVVIVGAYAGLGAIVLLSRWLAPNPRRTAPAQPAESEAEPVAAGNEAEPLPIAA